MELNLMNRSSSGSTDFPFVVWQTYLCEDAPVAASLRGAQEISWRQERQDVERELEWQKRWWMIDVPLWKYGSNFVSYYFKLQHFAFNSGWELLILNHNFYCHAIDGAQPFLSALVKTFSAWTRSSDNTRRAPHLNAHFRQFMSKTTV